MELNKIYCMDCLDGMRKIDDNTIDCCVTSPPYWGLRDYGNDDQLGLEETPEQYVSNMVQVFAEVRRVLKPEGTLWLNLGDSYAMSSMRGKNSEFKGAVNQSNVGIVNIKKSIPDGLKPKDLVGIPWRTAFALQADGWWLRQDIIWHKPNPMPESVTDRCTKAHEYIFLLTKSAKYYYDNEAIKEDSVDPVKSKKRYEYNFSGRPGLIMPDGKLQQIAPEGKREFNLKRNKRSVWTVTTKPYKEAHFATYPPDLIEPCILAGCPDDGIVLDPFMGSGTTAEVALKHNRHFVGFEIGQKYVDIANKRIKPWIEQERLMCI
jgi:DNA modification methylase